ncbi:MAG: ATP-binding protein [Candidatus Aminicenantes bacterium]|nr:ATP-binding protein [Candidatus Aminicenantes bacterium]
MKELKSSIFVDRQQELEFLNREYAHKRASFVIIYGRRRIGKTALIKHFIADKPALYFLASEELERENINNLKSLMSRFSGSELLQRDFDFSWDDIFAVFRDFKTGKKKIVIIDEFQYLSKANKAIPSIFQRIWDELLKDENVMLILCGSLINMMRSQTLDYSSPLYGRRTGQIKLKQIGFPDYGDFFQGKDFSGTGLIEYYAVTGGVPKYIELFNLSDDIFTAIRENIVNRQGFLYEEPIFLLEREVNDIGTYFSIIKTIAHGHHKLGKIASALGVSQAKLTRYLRTLIDLDLLERIVPVTESSPEKSKKGLYYITDNFIEFWFKFIYPSRSYIELDDIEFVMEKIKRNFFDNHVSFVFERVCLQRMWQLNRQNEFAFKMQRIGKWWDKDTEIDIVGLNSEEKAIIFGECKYLEKEVDVDLFYRLVQKADRVDWFRGERREYYILFSKSGFTGRLRELSRDRGDIKLVSFE